MTDRMKPEQCGNCDFYDPYLCSDHCEKYDTYPQMITRCEYKTVKGAKVVGCRNPLIMKRELRFCEVWHKGQVRSTYNSFYNPDGIHDSQADHIDDEGNYTGR
jgi:hypothetical protein